MINYVNKAVTLTKHWHSSAKLSYKAGRLSSQCLATPDQLFFFRHLPWETKTPNKRKRAANQQKSSIKQDNYWHGTLPRLWGSCLASSNIPQWSTELAFLAGDVLCRKRSRSRSVEQSTGLLGGHDSFGMDKDNRETAAWWKFGEYWSSRMEGEGSRGLIQRALVGVWARGKWLTSLDPGHCPSNLFLSLCST